jgi:hypothetical protein
MNIILRSVYAGNIDYYSSVINSSKVTIDINEHFHKQSYRNRCVIAGANGSLNLTIPVKRLPGKTALKDIRIDNDQNWRKIHWKSIESAYRTSPYFEYYEHEFSPFYLDKKYDFLVDLNKVIFDAIIRCLQIETKIEYSLSYIENIDDSYDLRDAIHPNNNTSQFYKTPNYTQVFQDRMDHLPNLSIYDLLFNEGPMALSQLKK